MAVDAIQRLPGFGPWSKKFKAEISEGEIGGEKVLLMKPQTFMNLSGEAVGEAMRFYKLTPADITTIYDELDLPPGRARIRPAAAMAAITASSRSMPIAARNTAACASASAIRARRNRFITMCSAISPSRIRSG